jgi:hypothetical protein
VFITPLVTTVGYWIAMVLALPLAAIFKSGPPPKTGEHPSSTVVKPTTTRSGTSLMGWIGLAVVVVLVVGLAIWRTSENSATLGGFDSPGSSSGKADAAEFKKSAQTFIEGDAVAKEAGTRFSNAICSTPSTVEAGAVFTCTAIDADRVKWNFSLVVKDSTNFEVTSGQPQG